MPVPLFERARRWCLVGLLARPGPHQLAPRGRRADVCVDVGPAYADVDQTAIVTCQVFHPHVFKQFTQLSRRVGNATGVARGAAAGDE